MLLGQAAGLWVYDNEGSAAGIALAEVLDPSLLAQQKPQPMRAHAYDLSLAYCKELSRFLEGALLCAEERENATVVGSGQRIHLIADRNGVS